MPQIVNIAIDRLFPHSDNPRKDLGDLSELAASIKASGILQNLTVVPDEPDNSNTDFTIIIGHRRYAAAKIAGLTELPCVVVEMSEREQLQTMLVENMQRSDLTVYEQAQGFQMMLNMGDSVAEIAEKSGFSQTTIRRRVKLLDLDRQKFQKAEARGATLNDYLELDKLDSPEDKNKALDAIGTANFNSVLKSLISEQEIQKKLAEWTEIADKFAYQIERSGEFNGTTVNMVYHAGYSRWDLKKEMTIPEDASDVRYFYRKDSTGITLYRERQQSQQPDPEADGREAWEVESIEPNEETLARILIAEFAKKQQGGHFACPRCGKMTMDAESVTRNALSRRVGCYICDTCGTVEAIEDFAHKQDSLSTWAIVREPERWHMLSWISDNIKIDGHEGTWYIIDEGDFQITPDVNGEPQTLTAHLFLLESRKFGDEAACLIVDKKKQLVMEDVWNGFDDLEDAGWERIEE